MFLPIALHIVYLVIRTAALTNEGGEEDLGEVVFVNILYRHGDRTPVDPYPNDPYRNTSYWPAGWGELTDKGKRGHYQLGRWLREQYDSLLPRRYSKDDIHVQSTDVDRTLMSAYSNLAGLYEPELPENWSQDIKWQPIPVHTTPEKSDSLLAAKKPCPKYDDLLQQLQNTVEFKKINEENKELYAYLSSNSGLNVTDLENVETLYNTMFIEALYGFRLPNWTEKVYPHAMKGLAELSFAMDCYNPELARLKIGPLIGQMVSHMEKKAEGSLKPDRKACVYSAHDTTVANMLQALQVFDRHCPPYLSLVLLELRRRNKDYFVMLQYRNSTVLPPQVMQIPGCDKLCPLEQFKKLTAPLVPGNWEKECQIHSFTGDFFASISGFSLATSATLATVFLAAILLALHLYKKSYYSKHNFVYHTLNMDVHS